MLEDLHKIELYETHYTKHQQYPSNIFTLYYYNAIEHGYELRYNVVRLHNQKGILCSVYGISILKNNQGNLT